MINVIQPFKSTEITPEWLAVWAPYLAESDGTFRWMPGGVSRLGSRWQDAIGRLLACVLNPSLKTHNAETAANLYGIFLQTIKGEHPLATFGGQVSYGLALSNSPHADQLLLDTLLDTTDDEIRLSLMLAIGEAGGTLLALAIKMIHEKGLWQYESVLEIHWELDSVKRRIGLEGSVYDRAKGPVCKHLLRLRSAASGFVD